MPNEEKMTIDERRKYLLLIRRLYLKRGKLERGRLLDEMEAITAVQRQGAPAEELQPGEGDKS